MTLPTGTLISLSFTKTWISGGGVGVGGVEVEMVFTFGGGVEIFFTFVDEEKVFFTFNGSSTFGGLPRRLLVVENVRLILACKKRN
jgi:hypothetical protein